jgi:GNAT superfamily N-acetyltransferase
MTSAPSRSQIQRTADDNMVAAYVTLVRHLPPPAAVERFGEVVAVVTGIPSPFFNPILGVGDALTEPDLRAAVRFAMDRNVGPSFQIRSDLAGPADQLATQLGFLREEPDTPGMVLDPMPATRLPGPPELRIEAVADEATAELWITVGVLGRHIPRPFLLDPAVRAVVGIVDGVPVTHGFVAASDNAIGVYAVGTVEAARRRGYGAAITWAAIRAGWEAWGDRPAILQSSELGQPVYRAMGFREICHYAIWYPAPEASPQG